MADENLRREMQFIAVEVVGRLTKAVNNISGEPEKVLAVELSRALRGEHRTLQASLMRTLRGMLRDYGETVDTDLRNEAAKKCAVEMARAGDEVGIPLI